MTNTSVRDQSAAVLSMAHEWELVSALMGGTAAMRAASKKYLPQWPAEDSDSYKTRLATATLFPAFQRTVEVLASKPFSKPLTISEDAPARIQELIPNIDQQGRNLHVFAADIAAEALGWGLSGILVDVPPADGVRTVAEEKQRGIRPYFVQIHPQNILGWRRDASDGSLSQLRLLETVTEYSGDFEEAQIEQVRVLYPGYWEVWRKQTIQGRKEWALFSEGVSTLPYIPFVPVYGARIDYMVGRSPLLELAHANVEHWQSKSDQQTILHVARVPLLFGKGLGDSGIVAGAGAMVRADNPDADLRYVEHSGAAIEAGRLSLLDLEDRMRQIGAELLVIKPGNITESQTLADNEPGMCALQRITEHLEDALDQAIDMAADWIGEAKGGTVSLYKDFGAASLAEAHAQLLYDMNQTGRLSLMTLYAELKRRGILGPDLDLEKEAVAAKKEAPSSPATIPDPASRTPA